MDIVDRKKRTPPLAKMLTVLLPMVLAVCGCQIPVQPSGPYAIGQGTGLELIRNALSRNPIGQAQTNQQQYAPLVQPEPTPFENGLNQAAYGGNHAAYGVNQAAYQESSQNTRPTPFDYTLSATNPPANQQQTGLPNQVVHPQANSHPNQMRGDSSPRFYADEMAKLIPHSATERVIQLTNEVAILRGQIQEISQSVERLKAENNQLYDQRNQLNLRMTSLETQLDRSRENEENARLQFHALSQRMQLFNARRQKQISELNRIIDQLETQLQRPVQTPTQNPSLPNPESTGDGNAVRSQHAGT